MKNWIKNTFAALALGLTALFTPLTASADWKNYDLVNTGTFCLTEDAVKEWGTFFERSFEEGKEKFFQLVKAQRCVYTSRAPHVLKEKIGDLVFDGKKFEMWKTQTHMDIFTSVEVFTIIISQESMKAELNKERKL